MKRKSVIAIFDVGKTNKKLFFFDEQYRIVYEEQISFPEILDEDGENCEDLSRLTSWVKNALMKGLHHPEYQIEAINFSAYGASFVHLDKDGRPLTPLYNYLKKYPEELSDEFYKTHGGAVTFSILTASPVLGSLNSGMQLYRIKKRNPETFRKIKFSLHLPQYLSFIVDGKYFSDITSIGCHTNLWNFPQNNYHEWVYREGVLDKLAPIAPFNHLETLRVNGALLQVGIGLHDSSAALIPYMESFLDPFILISTGTWCINLNPFNDLPLSVAELQEDCLCYLNYKGKPVKASRIFAGYQHEQESKRISAHFGKPDNYYVNIAFDAGIISQLRLRDEKNSLRAEGKLVFNSRSLSLFTSYEEAYHQLMLDIIAEQVHAVHLILEGTDVKRIFVDGGFGKNPVYMHLLAESFHNIEVFAASVSQATAMGAALALHHAWNKIPLPTDMIDLKFYSVNHRK
jgi:L-fuculokinase